MLIEFRVENHRSIHDEQVLSMEAGRAGGKSDPRPRKIPNVASKLLPVAALYGANASGKSNVLSALAYMREVVSHSHRFWSPDEGVPRDPFAWGEKRNAPSLYEVEMIIQGVRYRYGFVADDQAILEEWVHAWPHNKKQVWLDRKGDVFKFGEQLKGENRVIEGLTRPNALYLSAAAQLRHNQLAPLFSWFSSFNIFNLPLTIFQRRYPSFQMSSVATLASMLGASVGYRQPDLFEEEPTESLLDQFKSLLKSADIGIVDLRLSQEESRSGSKLNRSRRFELKHQSEEDDAWLPLTEESRGTQTLFQLGLPILLAIQRGTILIVDELEASMHPNLAELIVRQFNDPEINSQNAQLIFTTHDTNLIGTLTGEPALRRDQVWLTEKDRRGATVLYPLTDFKPREGENLERGYIQGRFGAVPFLGSFRVPGEDSQ